MDAAAMCVCIHPCCHPIAIQRDMMSLDIEYLLEGYVVWEWLLLLPHRMLAQGFDPTFSIWSWYVLFVHFICRVMFIRIHSDNEKVTLPWQTFFFLYSSALVGQNLSFPISNFHLFHQCRLTPGEVRIHINIFHQCSWCEDMYFCK